MKINNPPKPGDKRITLPAIPDDHPGDCMNVAVTLAYGIPYEETGGFKDVGGWDLWARERGLRIWISTEYAPCGQSAWIACVDGPSGQPHALAMSYDRFLAERSPKRKHVHPSEIRAAIALIPIDQDGIGGTVWPIINPQYVPLEMEIK